MNRFNVAHAATLDELVSQTDHIEELADGDGIPLLTIKIRPELAFPKITCTTYCGNYARIGRAVIYRPIAGWTQWNAVHVRGVLSKEASCFQQNLLQYPLMHFAPH